jgi:hypothetical protein|tara:strand:- start:229 stop:438 length:210 start_codon:yes stop_codon:yes gene_type:complete
MKEVGAVTSKTMSGDYFRELSKQDTVGEISDKNITNVKQVIDDATARFWAKRGIKDSGRSGIAYGKKVK